jgi:hypothetical protein
VKELVAGVLLPTIAFACIAIGVPLIAYNLFRMSRHKLPSSRGWRDLWGLNPNNLIFFPDLLTEEGRGYRRLAIKGVAIVGIGVLAIVLASQLS